MFGGNELIFCDTDETQSISENADIDINTLIEKCRTDRKSLELLYDTFKKDVFAIS